MKVPSPNEPCILLATHEDFNPEALLTASSRVATVLVAADPALLWGDEARRFVSDAARETAVRVEAHFHCPVSIVDRLDAETLAAEATAAGVRQIVTAYAPTGPMADAFARIGTLLSVEGIALVQVRRSWDAAFWPHARKGFFPFKDRIPGLLREFGHA